MTCIAILDKNFNLVGLKELEDGEKAPKGAVELSDGCDLPLDGTYHWQKDEDCFMPAGHGYGHALTPPISIDKVVYHLAKAMENPPQEIVDWIAWQENMIR